MRGLHFLFPLGLLWTVASLRARKVQIPGSSATPPRASASPVLFGDARRLHTLDATVPEARAHFEALLTEARARGLRPQIISAVRTCAEQRSVNPKVLRSWHPLGRAIDLELAGATVEDYTRLGEWWEQRGGVWGGRWVEQYPVAPCGPPGAAGDVCHFQWTKGLRVEDIWTPGVPCEDVTARFLRAQGSAWSPAEGWIA